MATLEFWQLFIRLAFNIARDSDPQRRRELASTTLEGCQPFLAEVLWKEKLPPGITRRQIVRAYNLLAVTAGDNSRLLPPCSIRRLCPVLSSTGLFID